MNHYNLDGLSTYQEYKNAIDNGANATEIYYDGSTSLFNVSDFNENSDIDTYRSIVNLLISSGVDVNHTDMYGYTALMRSCSDNFSVALLENGAHYQLVVDSGDICSSLVEAIIYGHTKTITYIIENLGVDPNREIDMHNRTALHMACEYIGRVPIVKYELCKSGISKIIDYGADVNSKDVLGYTPLHLTKFSLSCAESLIENGADVNVTIKRGEEVNISLIHDAHCKSYDVVKLLLENGLDVNSITSEGNTPILNLLDSMGILTHNTICIFDLFIHYGAKCSIRNIHGFGINDTVLGNIIPFYPVIRTKLKQEKDDWDKVSLILISRYKDSYSNDKTVKWVSECPDDVFGNILRYV